MNDIALVNAKAVRDDMARRIAVAEGQIKEWRAAMQRAERFITDWEEFAAPSNHANLSPETATTESTYQQVEPDLVLSPRARNPKKEAVADAALAIIEENGRPMTRDELFAALSARGIAIHGANPAIVLQTMLWRMRDRIVHIKGFGYWPREQAYMAAEYVGDDEEVGNATSQRYDDEDLA